MIEKLVVVGWLALALLLGGGISGYFLGDGDEALRVHLGLALLTGSAFLFTYGGLAIYLLGTALLVRRTVRRQQLDPRWVREHRSCWALSLAAITLALVSLALVIASGFPTHVGAWDPWIHHLLFPVTVALQVPTLLLLRSRVSRGEALLRTLGQHLHPAVPSGPALV